MILAWASPFKDETDIKWKVKVWIHMIFVRAQGWNSH